MSDPVRAWSAGRWSAISAAIRLAVQFAQTLLLARILGPEAFGAMAIVGGLLAILSLVSDLGLSKALIHFDAAEKEVLSNLFWCSLVLSVVVCLVFAASARLVAGWFKNPELVGIVVLGSTVLPISALGQQLRSLAEKDLRFKELAAIEVGAACLGFVAAIILALQNAGAYALLGALLISAVANSALAWLFLRGTWRPMRWTPGIDLGRYLRYGGYLMGDGLTSAARMQSDVLIAGLVASPASVGLYTVTRDLSLKIANSLVNPVVTRISLPLMAQIQSDRERLKRAYLKTIQIVSLINFPAYVALGLYAQEVVLVLYGPAWTDAAFFLRMFAVWGLVRCVGNPSGSLLYAAGYARTAFFWNALFLVLIPPLLALGAWIDGLPGLTWSMLITQIAFFFVSWKVFVERASGAGLLEYLSSMVPALLCAVIAGACAFALTYGLQSPHLRLIVGGIAGGFVYLASSMLINRQACAYLLQFWPSVKFSQ